VKFHEMELEEGEAVMIGEFTLTILDVSEDEVTVKLDSHESADEVSDDSGILRPR